MATIYFTAIVEGGDAPGYSVFFPDLPGCASAGDTVEQAARNAEEALSLHLAGMVEDGGAIPSATPPEQIAHDPDVREVARMLVRSELPGRSVRLNISMDEGLVAALDKAARARDTTRSGLLAEAARRLLATA
ncbi:MAG TPA: type II toxin-antitoxin system HicB family antitoxin [Stellaceae bacterium]|nr:type II toxin-antitoxin system HicB family antitoxin [Stellaceae bacterium]